MSGPSNEQLKAEVAELRARVHELTTSVLELTSNVKELQRIAAEHHDRIGDTERTLFGKNPKGLENDPDSVVGLIRNLSTQARLLKWMLGFMFGGGLLTLASTIAFISSHVK